MFIVFEFMKVDFLLQSSPWLVPICLLTGAIYAYVLYQKNSNSWNKRLLYSLTFLRFLAVSITSLLLLNFLIRQIKQDIIRKTVVLAIDNSQSMLVAGKKNLSLATSGLTQLKKDLEDKDFEVSFASLDDEAPENIDNLKFSKKITDLSGLINKVKNNFEGQNLVDVVLVSDGISNEGIAPGSEKYNFQVHTIGLGDTVQKKDLLLKAVYANKIAYLGNKFPIQADVSSFGFSGHNATVFLKQGGKILEKQQVFFKQNDDVKTLTFNTTASQVGVQHFVVEIEPVSGEFTTRNNRQDVYLEVIDGKEKILLLALAPHPDLKALKSIIEKNDNYELDIRILTQNPNPDLSGKSYDLLILHQLPDAFNSYANVFKPLINNGLPCLFVLGNQSGTTYLNQLNQVMQINSNAGQSDKVTGIFNNNFRFLNFEADRMELIKKFPQISVPFGEYKILPGTEVLLYQKVGNLATPKPLFAVNTGAKKSAIFAGEGLWSWRLEEFQLTEKQEVADELFLKVIQYISAKDDKRKLRVYPVNSEILLGEKVVFETEIYNGIYEKQYDIPIKLEIKDEKGSSRNYTFTTSQENAKFEISGLPQGIYRFKAGATVSGKQESASGEFVIKDLQIETMNTRADFDALRQLSAATGAKFYQINQFENVQQAILNHKIPDRIDATEDLKELINLRWLFFLILGLLSLEWVLRKYNGSY